MHFSGFALTVLLALPGGTATQGGALDIRHNRRPPTVEEALQGYKIQLTKPALVSALRNADPEVRWLAAVKLAQDKATETIPAILEALLSERVAPTRVNMAFALAQLGEAKGFSGLQDTCRDRGTPPWLRLQAARYMLDNLKREDETCRKALIAILQSQPSRDSLVEAASLLRGLQNLSQEESQTVFEAALKALLAQEPSLRLAASHVLGQAENRAAIPYLQSAAAKEKDKIVRSQMQADVKRLQKQKP